MKRWGAMAAAIAAIICCMAFAWWVAWRHPRMRGYKDVYEQMHMERMIT